MEVRAVSPRCRGTQRSPSFRSPRRTSATARNRAAQATAARTVRAATQAPYESMSGPTRRELNATSVTSGSSGTERPTDRNNRYDPRAAHNPSVQKTNASRYKATIHFSVRALSASFSECNGDRRRLAEAVPLPAPGFEPRRQHALGDAPASPRQPIPAKSLGRNHRLTNAAAMFSTFVPSRTRVARRLHCCELPTPARGR